MQVQQTNLPNDFLMERINASIPDPKARVYPITFCIRKNPSHVVADVEGYLMAGVLYTDQLWVDQRYRRQGLGKQLMYKMHTFGQSHSCSMATVCTMSSQHALPFYIKVGYRIDFERKGYYNGSSCLFLKRIL